MKINPGVPVVVAIPAKDEAQRLLGCLQALAHQRGAAPSAIVLLLNNTTDNSARIAHEFAARSHLAIHIRSVVLPPGQASAGVARSIAMNHACALLDDGDGVLLSTDADSVAAPDWIVENLASLAHADAVAGRAVIDPAEARLLPARLHEDDALECAYALLLDEIDALIDPDPADPWPRHDEHSGASIAVWASCYRAAGGMPAIPLGEDRAFFQRLRRIDARIRHAPAVWVTVSGRIEGRARGGMADTIRRRLDKPDAWLDDRLEPADAVARRAALRELARQVFRGRSASGLAHRLGLALAQTEAAVEAPAFGMTWERLEAQSDVLIRRPVAARALEAETARARVIRDALRDRSNAAASYLDEHLPRLVE